MKTAKRKYIWLLACLTIASISGTPLFAQGFLGTGGVDSDMQYFSPVDLDFECQPLRKDCGYFLRFDKLSWAFTGERTIIGDPTLNVQSEIIFGNSPVSQGNPPPTFQINNSIQDAPPFAEFGWGERFEFGYFHNDAGWLVGVLDGPAATSQRTYGFQGLDIPNTIPVDLIDRVLQFDVDFTFASLNVNGIPNTGSFDFSTSRNGFGSVHVNFATPAGYLLGFRDYHVGIVQDDELGQGPTVGGPGRRVQLLTLVQDAITGEIVIDDITIANGAGDGTDNLDGDTIGGFFFLLADIDGDGMIDDDEIIADGVDFDDLHLFNVAFDTFTVRNLTETQGIEMMRTHDLSNRHRTVKGQSARAHIAYGVRYLRLSDEFFWEGRGGILGRTFADTTAQNSIVGPQVRYKVDIQRGRWNLGLDTRMLFGYNIQDLDQVGAIGEDLAPGALNRLAGAQPHAVAYGQTQENFSPVVEFRAESSYQLTSSIAFKLGYNATFVDNITRASQTVRWFLPDLGLLQGGEQDIFINGVTAGFELVH